MMRSFLQKLHFGRAHQSKKPKKERQTPKTDEKQHQPGENEKEHDVTKNQRQRRPPRLVRLRRTPPTASAAAPTLPCHPLPTTTKVPTAAATPTTKTTTNPTITTEIRRRDNSRSELSKRRPKSSDRSTTMLTVYTCTSGSNPLTSFSVDVWMKISMFLSRRDISHLRLASLGIRPRQTAVTLHPALTNHLNLNLDSAPWHDWVWKKEASDDNQLARLWCRRDGIIDFPRDISNAELELFVHHKEYLSRAKKVSFGRCRNLTVDWFEECLPSLSHLDYIEICLPPHINNEELSRCLPHLMHVTRLNCVGCSQLNEYGFELIGQLTRLKELYFLHW